MITLNSFLFNPVDDAMLINPYKKLGRITVPNKINITTLIVLVVDLLGLVVVVLFVVSNISSKS